MQKIRIHAVDDRRATLVNDAGNARRDRYAGRDHTGAPMPDGEVVTDHDIYQRQIRRGDLRLGVLEAPAPPPPAAPFAPADEVPS